jgi:uncharacterized protein (TIGR03437 family)
LNSSKWPLKKPTINGTRERFAAAQIGGRFKVSGTARQIMQRFITTLALLFCLRTVPVFASTAIGGGLCNSSTLMGTYELILSGRQTTATGAVAQIFQGVGTASFDGLSNVTLTLTANTVASKQSFGTQVVYSGTYSLQSNCEGAISVTTGDTATFTLEAFNISSTTQVAGAFALIGSDASYVYNGSGDLQPATCPTTLSGIYQFNSTGNALNGASVTAVLDLAGVMSFDGKGNVTANWTQASNLTVTTVAAVGSYTVASGCLASATLTDAANNTYAVAISMFSTVPDFVLAISSPQGVSDGSGSAVEASTPTPACSASVLNGTYYLDFAGRVLTGGVISKIFQSNGAATFDGQSKVTFTVTANTVNGSQAFGTPATYSGTYSIQSNCQGAINITGGETASLAIVAYSIDASTQRANSFTMVGTDATYALSGGGTVQPAACALSTLSGVWAFSGTANSLSGATNTGAVDLAGALQFDGQGNVTGTWTQASNTNSATVSATGTYTLSSGCLGTMTLTDNNNNIYTSSLSGYGTAGANFDWVLTDPRLIFRGTGRSSFVNPGEAVVNAASYKPSQTPPGSVFSIFGTDLSAKVATPSSVPLPVTLLNTTVTVNGESAPLFYVSPTQINAQMPADATPGVATVIVKNGSAVSNAVAVTVPGSATPGIVLYGNNQAVVVNSDNVTVNSPSKPAKPGEEVVVYFTGGGPVNPVGALATGVPAPNALSPISSPYSLTVNGVAATVDYIGLTPGSVGLYQANFVVPNVAAGSHPVVITISGNASNNPVMSVSN